VLAVPRHAVDGRNPGRFELGTRGFAADAGRLLVSFQVIIIGRICVIAEVNELSSPISMY